MPFLQRTTAPVDIQGAPIRDVQMLGGAAPVYQEPTDKSVGADSAFWGGLVRTAGTAANALITKKQAEAYVEGQEDATIGAAKEARSWLVDKEYQQGYNKITRTAQLAKLQLKGQQMAQEYANSGKDLATFEQDFGKLINEGIGTATNADLDLTQRDSIAWVNTLTQTKELVTESYINKSVEYRKNLNMQSHYKAANASMVELSSDAARKNPALRQSIMSQYMTRLNTDNSLDLPTIQGLKAAYFNGVFQNAGDRQEARDALQYISTTEDFAGLPIDIQSRLVQSAQSAYDALAHKEGASVLAYNFEMSQVKDYDEFDQKYPPNVVYGKFKSDYEAGIIDAPQMFSFLGSYQKQRNELMDAKKTNMLWDTASISQIATETGDTVDTVMTKAEKRYGMMGTAKGGAVMLLQGLQLKDHMRIRKGAEMLTTEAAGIALLDMTTVRYDKDGTPIIPENLNIAMLALKNAWDNLPANQREQVFVGLPESVKYGLRQQVDQRQMVAVIVDKQRRIANHEQFEPHPETLPADQGFTDENLSDTWFTWGWTKKGAIANTLGVPIAPWESAEDNESLKAIKNPLNNILASMYAKRVGDGKTSSTVKDTASNLKQVLANNTIRIDDGSPNKAYLILPDIDNKTKGDLFGTQDNETIAEAMQYKMQGLRTKYPTASAFMLDYDDHSQEFLFRVYTPDGMEIRGAEEPVRPEEVNRVVQGVQYDHQKAGSAKKWIVPLYVKNVGVIANYSVKNSWGVSPRDMADITQWIVHHEGYNDALGFSVLKSWHGPKYAKMPGDTPVQAAEKLNLYLNDKVLPQVVPRLQQYSNLPPVLRDNLRVTLAETTFHSGNVEAFGKFVDRLYQGVPITQVIHDFQSSDELFIRETSDERNAYRLRMLRDIAAYLKDTTK